MMRFLALALVALLAGCAETGIVETRSPTPEDGKTLEGAFEEVLNARHGGGWDALGGSGAFDVDPGAARLSFTIAWDATPAQALQVSLGVEGGAVAGSARGDSPLTMDVEDPSPGRYRILARPAQDPGVAVLVAYRWSATLA